MSLEYLTPEAMEGKTKEELVQLLIRAQQKHKQLAFQLQEVKVSHVELQNQAEAEEELIANTLFKKLEALESQKNTLLQQVEQEEEYLTNTLQKKLHDLEMDKTRLEERLEEEQEYIVNKLTKQLDEVLVEKQELQKQIEEANKSTAELMKAKNELKKVREETSKSIDDLKHQNFHLSQHIDQQRVKLEAVNRQKLSLEREMEVENEKQFNLGSSPSGISPLRLRAPSSGSSSSPVPIPIRSPRTSLGNILQTKMLKTGDLLVRMDPTDIFRELHVLLSARGILLGFADADYAASYAEPEFKVLLDKVLSVTQSSKDSFLVKTKDGQELMFKAEDDIRTVNEWRELINSLLP